MSSETGLFSRLFGNNPDDVIVGASPIPENETGRDRLRKMFSLDEYGYQSKELTMITQGTIVSTMIGGVMGAVIHSREAFVTFLENNQATKFYNHLDAKRELTRVMFLAFGKGSFRWGWRIGAFTLSYTSVLTMTSVYWGKESLLDYIIAAGVTGGIFRAHMGFKGIVAGTAVGSALGLIGGTASLLVLKAGGSSLAELSEFSREMRDARERGIREGVREQMIKEYADFKDGKLNDEAFKNLKVDDDQ